MAVRTTRKVTLSPRKVRKPAATKAAAYKCRCGCGKTPKGAYSMYMPGHDNRINPNTGRRYNGR